MSALTALGAGHGRAGSAAGLAGCLAAIDWQRLGAELDAQGWALTGPLLDMEACRSLRTLWDDEAAFRSRVVMARHGFGRGEYKYFADPLPLTVAALRHGLYPQLVPIANRWQAMLRLDSRFPGDHAAFLARCHEAGQARPTPLLLRYGVDDYNCLHQDLYGPHVFPLQVAFSSTGRAATSPVASSS